MAENEPKENETEVIPMPKEEAPKHPASAEGPKPVRIMVELKDGAIAVSGDINDTVTAAGLLTRALWYVQKRVDDEQARKVVEAKILQSMRDGTFPMPGGMGRHGRA